MDFDFKRRGILCVVSGPSGSGKTTVCRSFSDSEPDCVYAVSCTTRAPRTGEVDGIDYHFLSREDFEQKTTRGDFLEWAEVHGNFYGTLKSEVLSLIDAGTDVLIDIDVQGAELIRKNDDPLIAEARLDVFIMPPSRDELIDRLDKRGTETAEQLDTRLNNALEEMRHWGAYHYTIISRSREDDLARFAAIIRAERCRSARLQPHESTEAHPDLFE